MTNSERIAELKEKIEHEYQEEYKYVRLFRPLIKDVEDLSKSFFSRIFNKGEIDRLNEKMQGYADMANYHQRRKCDYQDELRELERALR